MSVRLICTGLTLLLALSCSREHSPVGDDGEREYQLVWADEFDGPVDQLPDPANWTYDIGNGSWGWGNNQLEYDTNDPANVSLDGEGNLRLTARQQAFQSFDYTSARILTRGLYEPMHGRIEARILLPVGQGIWPAFWMLGSNISSVGWPQCGEIDIMEYRGQQPSVILGTLHGPGYSGGQGISQHRSISPAGFHEDFHVFGVEWDSGGIRWTLDGELYHRVNRDQVPGPWVFDQPFQIILNVAVGGNFIGPPNATTEFPQTMTVDWVRVYQER